MAKRVKASEILRTAAKRINTGLKSRRLNRRAGCGAIWDASDYLDSRPVTRNEAERYFAMMRPKNAKLYWFGTTFSKAEQERRMIALLLAAAIAEANGN